MISINDFNFNRSTIVCKTMYKYGSDKGHMNCGYGWHNYSIVYNKLFESLFDKPLRIFEIGLGSINPAVPSNMGAQGKPGASLLGWRDLFPNSLIFGADIDPATIFQAERIKTFVCDQTSEVAVREMWNKNPELDANFDIIIDDALHTFSANQSFFKSSIHKLKKGGYFIIEDIRNDEMELFNKALVEWKKTYPHLTFSMLSLPLDINKYDNNLLVIQNSSESVSLEKRKYLELAAAAPKNNTSLVYFCVFFNPDYFRLVQLLMKSVHLYSETKTIDFLVLTTEDFHSKVYELCASLGIYIKIFTLPLKTIFQAACARLNIFDYEGLSKYNTMLYLDTDIIVKGNLETFFGLRLEERIYAIESGTIHSPSFGAQFFNRGANPAIKGFNSGTLLFPNSLKIRDVFSRIRGHCDSYADSGAAIPYCMDQPFINYHFIKSGLYDNTLLNPLVSLFEGYDAVKNVGTSIVCHFSFPIGNSGHKHNRMSKYFIELLEAPKGAVGTMNMAGKRSTWGSGFLEFKENGIETTWSTGKYESLGNNFYRVHWNGYVHVIWMNENYTEYFGYRLAPNDFEICRGALIL